MGTPVGSRMETTLFGIHVGGVRRGGLVTDRTLVRTAVLALALAAGRPRLPEAAAGSVAAAPALLVRVVEDVTRQPLPNAEVIDLGSGARRFTNGDGEARLAWPDSGRLRLRVRQLGFQFVDRALVRASVGPSAVDSVTVTLTRVAYTLPRVATRATLRCDTETDTVTKLLAAAALEQLRMGAERYDAFRKAYPFQVRQQRRTVRFASTGKAKEVRDGTEDVRSEDWGEPYRPGRVIEQNARGFSVPLLFLSALADSVFWEHHCFAVRGVESLHNERVLRLEFSPALGVRRVDWTGAALIDSATSVLRRVDFALVGLDPSDVPRRLVGHTTFRSPSPFIVIPDSTLAMWWRRDPVDTPAWDGPDVVQLIRSVTVRYRKARPPAPDR